MAVMGTPQAIASSENLKTWYPLHVEDFSENFDSHLAISEGTGAVACSTGKNLIVFEKKTAKDLMSNV